LEARWLPTRIVFTDAFGVPKALINWISSKALHEFLPAESVSAENSQV